MTLLAGASFSKLPAQTVARGVVIDTVLEVTGSLERRIAIERDGWIIVGYGSDRAAAGWDADAVREFLAPDDVLAWVEEAERLLGAATQAGMTWPGGATSLLGPPAGRRFKLVIEAQPQYNRLNISLTTYHCQGFRLRSHNASVPEAHARALLETLGLAARRTLGTRQGVPPTPPSQGAVFWQHAVSCPARGEATNASPISPAAGPGGSSVAVQFVVDTLGRVELSTLEALSGRGPALARAIRQSAATWRFTPAMRGGHRVRQVMQGTVLVLPRPLADHDTVSEISAEPGGAGLVHVFGLAHNFGLGRDERRTQVHGAALDLPRDFYEARPLLEWADSVERLLARGPLGNAWDNGHPNPRVGFPIEPRLELWTYDNSLVRRTCRDGVFASWHPGERFPRLLEVLREAARAALPTAGRTESVSRVYEPHEVPCPAVPLVELRPPLRGSDLQETREVLLEFVVDSGGRADPGTLAVPRGTPPDIVQALRAILSEARFLPALRGGRRVAQRFAWRSGLEPGYVTAPPSPGRPATCLPWGSHGTRLVASDGNSRGTSTIRPLLDRLIRELARSAEPGDWQPHGDISIGIGGRAPPSIVVQLTAADPSQELLIYRWIRDALRRVKPPQDGLPATANLSFEYACALLH